MSISEFALHNVLRTYTRQERLGQAHRALYRSGAPPPPAGDQIQLSPAGRKIQWAGQLAAEVVDRRHPGLAPEDRAERVRRMADALVARHREEIGDDALSTEAFAQLLRPLYLG
jgi:hypothetical protein